MKWLLWREYRLIRPILIFGCLLLLLPYAFALGILFWRELAQNVGTRYVAEFLFSAAINSVILFQLALAVLGGNAIAGERADRSAEFISYLPLSRPRRLAAKLTVTLAAVALLWGVNLLIMAVLLTIAPNAAIWEADELPLFFGQVAITGLTFFGVGWLLSSLQSSPTFAVGGGLVTPLVIAMGLLMVGEAARPLFSGDFVVTVGYAVICPIVVVACFSIGTWYYLRRVEP